VLYLVGTMPRQVRLDRIQIDGAVERERLLAEHSLAIEIPVLPLSHGTENLEAAGRRIENDLHDGHFFLGDEERFLHLEVFDGIVFVGEKLARDGQADFAVPGRRKNDAVPETVIVEPGEVTRGEFESPGRTRSGLRETEERVLEGSAAEVLSLGGLQPESLLLPGVGGQAHVRAVRLV